MSVKMRITSGVGDRSLDPLLSGKGRNALFIVPEQNVAIERPSENYALTTVEVQTEKKRPLTT